MLLTFASLLLSGASLVLPAEARVRGSELRLDSLALVRCEDEELRARLAAFGLGWTPAPGYVRTLRRWQLERDLELAFPGVAFDVAGAESCRVLPETERIRGDALRASAQAELESFFAARDARVRAHGAVPDLEVPLARERTELRAALEKRDFTAGAWSVPVQVWVDGQLYRTIWVAFDVEAWADLPVLTRDVRRGESLSADALEMRRVALDARTPISWSGSELAGAVALRDLSAGSVPGERDVERARLVRAGDEVQLQVRKGPILARSSAVAREAGYLGQRIRVTTADRTRELSAEVIGRGVVEVDLSPVRLGQHVGPSGANAADGASRLAPGARDIPAAHADRLAFDRSTR